MYRFFHNGSTSGFRRDELLALSSRINDLIGWFEVQTCAHFVSSSLLIVYDACEDDRPHGTAMLTVKMIDFTHTVLHNSGTVSSLLYIMYYSKFVYDIQISLLCDRLALKGIASSQTSFSVPPSSMMAIA